MPLLYVMEHSMAAFHVCFGISETLLVAPYMRYLKLFKVVTFKVERVDAIESHLYIVGSPLYACKDQQEL